MPTATCMCGECHLEIDSIIGSTLCHCTICRKMSSSSFTINTAIPASALRIIRGEPKIYILTGASGATSDLRFCGNCGSHLFLTYAPNPELRILKAGVLDGDDALETDAIKLKAEQHTRRRCGWLKPAEGIRQIEGQMQPRQAKEMRKEAGEVQEGE
jgi:hypothetical protein